MFTVEEVFDAQMLSGAPPGAECKCRRGHRPLCLHAGGRKDRQGVGRGCRRQEENVSPEDVGVNWEWSLSRPAGWGSEGTTGFGHMEAISYLDKGSVVVKEGVKK